ncbi:MAG TPA: SCO family protein [Myxococcota bacterium]|nr:SCO family protein [Myxococcota bacterium]
MPSSSISTSTRRLRSGFVSVGSAPDTPAAMKAFLEARHPRSTGLTGSPEQVDAATCHTRRKEPCRTSS